MIYGILGIASTVVAFAVNRRLFTGGAGRPGHGARRASTTWSACARCVLGWYFNVRYTHLYGHRANYVNYTKMLFTNWAADSAAQDYIIVNVVLLPAVDHRRRHAGAG